jgi:hypothetical protein
MNGLSERLRVAPKEFRKLTTHTHRGIEENANVFQSLSKAVQVSNLDCG